METGVVKWFNDSRGYGFITDADGKDIFVHSSDLQTSGFKTLQEGQRVTFQRVRGDKGVQAASVQILQTATSADAADLGQAIQALVGQETQPVSRETSHERTEAAMSDVKMESEAIEELDTASVDQEVLAEIFHWKREAKAEDNDRYFWHVREVDQLARGEKYFVIGRKGSGKTAICEYFNRRRGYDVFAEKLTFKNFPFNELYSQKNTKYTPPNQFISIWKYLIYSTVCRLMLKNEAISGAIREQLTQLYGDNTPLSRRVGQWVGKEFGVSLFGLSVKVSRQLPTSAPESWVDHLDFLEDFVSQHAGNATYYVLFDELDEDYRDIVEKAQYHQYTALITSLFKAVQDIRTTSAQHGAPHIYPVVFLRDDIYELVQDSDKNKWGDFRVDLNWDPEKIKKVIAFRISRAIDANCQEILPFDTAWRGVFGSRAIGVGSRGKNRISTFEFIARSTLLRPRDFVAYLQSCAQHAVEDGTKIGPDVVRRVDKAFSNYLRDELTDELFAVLPDISNIFDAISQLRKWNFSIQELERA
jgi:cold shock CspA family protein